MSNEIPAVEKMRSRSPLLMNRDDSALLVIDVQARLLPSIDQHERLVFNIRRLIEGAKQLGVRVAATEQYPKGLGGTTEELANLLPAAIPEKLMFSCRECEQLIDEFDSSGISKILLTGIETHVCVAQTAFDLLAAGFDVYVCVDAVGSRNEIDYLTAIRRMEAAGVTPTTTEAALFEWCEVAGSAEFKAISKLVQEKQT